MELYRVLGYGEKKRTHIDGYEMDFGMTVFAGFRGGHVDDLARTT